MFITLVIVNFSEFFLANYDSYEKSQQSEPNKKFFRQEIHASMNLFMKIVYNN